MFCPDVFRELCCCCFRPVDFVPLYMSEMSSEERGSVIILGADCFHGPLWRAFLRPAGDDVKFASADSVLNGSETFNLAFLDGDFDFEATTRQKVVMVEPGHFSAVFLPDTILKEGSKFFVLLNFTIFADVYFFLILDVCEVQLRLLGLVRLRPPRSPKQGLARWQIWGSKSGGWLTPPLGLVRSLAGPSGPVRLLQRSESQRLRLVGVRSRRLRSLRSLLCIFRGMLTISGESMVCLLYTSPSPRD